MVNNISTGSKHQLLDCIVSEIDSSGGKISFHDYMWQALYTPELGYYCRPHFRWGEDFITAALLSPLFAECLGQQCQQILYALGSGDILEMGAGSGRMAIDILLHLEKLDTLPQHYYILEISGSLRKFQKENIKQHCPHLLSKVVWLNDIHALPFNFQGVVVANEFFDALPVHRFRIDQGQCYEAYVTVSSAGQPDRNSKVELDVRSFTTAENLNLNIDNPLKEIFLPCKNEKINTFCRNLNLTEDYTSEINLNINFWVNTLAQHLKAGILLFIDYGFGREAYYHPERNSGTLMCHTKHHHHPDPLRQPGAQDITAHVDFTALAEAGLASGLSCYGYQNQASFLLKTGLIERLAFHQMQAAKSEDKALSLRALKLNQSVQLLTSPTEMGELFKVIALGKNLDLPLLGFQGPDLRHAL